ncbi:BPSL0067 family protein [Trinickia symbiotica]|uniref:BPSL0067 family protein n=1 Tax=Trinickia symbiotica TaxID=863227 RepID=UPI00215988C9|nr:BPSL0067 family protein [Trinickia symbiotica]
MPLHNDKVSAQCRISVIDQWSTSGTIRKRRLRFPGKDKNGNYISPSDNGDAFSVIK